MPLSGGWIMVTALVLSSLLSVALAALYIHAHYGFSLSERRHIADNAALQAQIKTLQEKLAINAQDPVTQLLGWQLFEDRVNQAIKESARYQFIMGVLYIDIDDFKLINSALGFEAANGLLLETAERLQTCIRQVDSISRAGKDTFVILLAQLAKQETAAIIIQRILQVLSQPYQINGQTLTITVCIGAAFYPNDGVTVGEITHHAEYAMLQAKTRGKHTYQFHQEQLQSNSQRELLLYNSISSEMFLDELHLVYQPIVHKENQKLCVAEAQVIWKHPVLGDISCEELMQLADKHRKLNKLTEAILTKACRQFQEWRAMGLKPELLGVPIWLKQLENTQFIYRLSQIIQDLKMQPAWLLLAIKESQSSISLDILEKSFNMLQYLGIRIAIDHFGSGAFSLRCLKVFSVQYLKLDPAMVMDVVENERARALVKAVIAFANTLNLSVIASGVEEKGQANVLSELGIDLMQGRLLGQPLSESEMTGRMLNV